MHKKTALGLYRLNTVQTEGGYAVYHINFKRNSIYKKLTGKISAGFDFLLKLISDF